MREPAYWRLSEVCLSLRQTHWRNLLCSFALAWTAEDQLDHASQQTHLWADGHLLSSVVVTSQPWRLHTAELLSAMGVLPASYKQLMNTLGL